MYQWQLLPQGYAGVTSTECTNKGCCWSPAGDNSATPWCFYSDTTSSSEYSLSNVQETATGFTGQLSLVGDGNTVYGDSIKNLKLSVIYEANDYVRVKITDMDSTRWEVPTSLVPRPSASTKASSPTYTLNYTETPFSFEVFRNSDSASIFQFSSEFLFKDQYIEFTVPFSAEAKTFGLGESARTHHALSAGSTFTLWARDEPAAVLDTNLYGSFPYYLQLLDGRAHGAMLFNSNGMDVRLYEDSLKFQVIGGVVDLYVFTGSSPSDVVRQYTDVVGRPVMQPYWAFGFHVSVPFSLCMCVCDWSRDPRTANTATPASTKWRRWFSSTRLPRFP